MRLPGKGNSNSHGARPFYLIITMIVDSDQEVVNKELSFYGQRMVGEVFWARHLVFEIRAREFQ